MKRIHSRTHAVKLTLGVLALGLTTTNSRADFENHKIVTDSEGLWQGTVELNDLTLDSFVFPNTRFWDVEVSMLGRDPFVQGSLFVKATHKHAPHFGETNPGPELLASLDVTIVPGVWGPATDVEQHFAHPDTLTMQLDARQFVPGDKNAILSIQLEHPDVIVPAPATLACLGMAGLVATGRRRSRRPDHESPC